MKSHTHTLHCLLLSSVASLALISSGCSKKETPPAAPGATSEPATPAAPAQPAAPTASAPAVPKADPLKSMADTATKAAESTAAKVNEVATPAAPTTQAPAALQSGLAAAQADAAVTTKEASAGLAASAGALQKQAEELLTRYSGELATLKTGALSVKSYIDKNPEVLPASAKASYQQFNSMMPQLESLVGTIKDYQNVDLTTLVPKLQSDFTKAKSLYSEVRALLPEQL